MRTRYIVKYFYIMRLRGLRRESFAQEPSRNSGAPRPIRRSTSRPSESTVTGTNMRVILAALAATTIAGAQAQAATEPRIGTTATAQRDVSGTLAGTRRMLKLGDGVFQNEDI